MVPAICPNLPYAALCLYFYILYMYIYIRFLCLLLFASVYIVYVYLSERVNTYRVKFHVCKHTWLLKLILILFLIIEASQRACPPQYMRGSSTQTRAHRAPHRSPPYTRLRRRSSSSMGHRSQCSLGHSGIPGDYMGHYIKPWLSGMMSWLHTHNTAPSMGHTISICSVTPPLAVLWISEHRSRPSM